MLRYFINRISGRLRLIGRYYVAVPVGATSTERRAVIDACLAAGAKNAYIIKKPIAAAVGRNPIAAPEGQLVIDIGGGNDRSRRDFTWWCRRLNFS